MNEQTYSRRKCDECDQHPLMEKDIADFLIWIKEHSVYSEKVQSRIGDRVKISQFRWVSGALGVLLILILGLVVTLNTTVGDLRTEIRVANAEDKATLKIMNKQIEHMAKIQASIITLTSRPKEYK